MKSFALAILATSAMAVSLKATAPAKKEFDSNGHNVVEGENGMWLWDDGQVIQKDSEGRMINWVRKDPLIEKYGVKYCKKGPDFICEINGEPEKPFKFVRPGMRKLRDDWL